MKRPGMNVAVFERSYRLLPNLADYVAEHARANPGGVALIEHNTGVSVPWRLFDDMVNLFASRLLQAGLKKGDVVATTLPLTKEHVFLIYACYRSGFVVAPLDLRLKGKEISYCFQKVSPAAYFFLGRPMEEFRDMMRDLMESSPSVRLWVQAQKEPEGILDGALSFPAFLQGAAGQEAAMSVVDTRAQLDNRDPCLIIFTTGSTGSPKPALLCHENILLQNIGLTAGFGITPEDRMLINLPPSHVGCITEELATIIYLGGVAVLLHIFEAQKSLEAIQEHKVNYIGQIPALFAAQWKLSNYREYDLSSLKFAIYGGQAVSKDFLENLAAMAPRIGTGLGLTELGGFCTFTDPDAKVEELARGIGFDSPLCPISIREPMKSDGSAGNEKSPGETGEVCFTGPQVFLGYLNDEESTRRAVSTDGICYTGDIGSYDDDGLHFIGRERLIIKPKGYQVFPEDVENHILLKFKDTVTMAGCVGYDHRLYTEAILAFVEHMPDRAVSTEDVMQACRDMATYSRPTHVEVLPPGGFPLNRVGKTDYMRLKELAGGVVQRLRGEGKWDTRG